MQDAERRLEQEHEADEANKVQFLCFGKVYKRQLIVHLVSLLLIGFFVIMYFACGNFSKL